MNARPMMNLLTLAMFVAGGCTNELQQARLEADECRLELNALKAKMVDPEEVTRLRAQRDRLGAQNDQLKDRLAVLEQEQTGLRAQIDEFQTRLESNSTDLDTRRRELERALANIRNSRQQWEDTLADRQRQIDILTSEVERLRRQVTNSPPSTPAE